MAQYEVKFASDKQEAFIDKLVVERVGGGVTVSAVLQQHGVDEITQLPSKAASAIINDLLKAPRNPAPAVALVEQGFYFDAEAEKVYQVVASKGTGNLYAKVMVPPAPGKKKGRWEYAPGAIKQAGNWSKITGESAAELSTKFGWCVACGAFLTATKSVAAGIGPICAKKF